MLAWLLSRYALVLLLALLGNPATLAFTMADAGRFLRGGTLNVRPEGGAIATVDLSMSTNYYCVCCCYAVVLCSPNFWG